MFKVSEYNENDYLLNHFFSLFENNNNDYAIGFNPLDSFQLIDSNLSKNTNLFKDSNIVLEEILKDKIDESFDLPGNLISEIYKNKNQIPNKEINYKSKATGPKTQDSDNKNHNNNEENKNIINEDNKDDNNMAIFIQNIDEKSNNANKNEVIFDIQKIKKNGRIPKAAKNFKRKHNKMTDDNIIRKIKAKFYNNIVDYINILYEKSSKKIKKFGKEKQINKFLQKIISSESKVIKKKDNLNWF